MPIPGGGDTWKHVTRPRAVRHARTVVTLARGRRPPPAAMVNEYWLMTRSMMWEECWVIDGNVEVTANENWSGALGVL